MLANNVQIVLVFACYLLLTNWSPMIIAVSNNVHEFYTTDLKHHDHHGDYSYGRLDESPFKPYLINYLPPDDRYNAVPHRPIDRENDYETNLARKSLYPQPVYVKPRKQSKSSMLPAFLLMSNVPSLLMSLLTTPIIITVLLQILRQLMLIQNGLVPNYNSMYLTTGNTSPRDSVPDLEQISSNLNQALQKISVIK